MRNLLLPEIDHYRVKSQFVLHQLGSFGNEAAGMFVFPNKYRSDFIKAIASVGLGWEHVSVSIADKFRCPSWDEMKQCKELFWEPEETVIQFHPKDSEYVNHHPYCLHLWRKVGVEYELPPSHLVGPKK